MTPTVTFLLPVYNGQPFLIEALDSIRNQTCPSWKCIVVDDASTDGSQSVIQGLTDPRIRHLFHDINKGLYGTLAETIALVDTEWVAIVMQDDRLKPIYLQEMMALTQQFTQVDAFWATEDLIGEDGNRRVKGRDSSRLEAINPGAPLWADVLRRGCFWTISGSFTRKSLFQALPFRREYPHCGDFEWLLRAARHAHFLYYERSLMELRVHQRQASAINLLQGRDVQEAYIIIRDNLRTHGGDISGWETLSICLRRAKDIATKILAALRHGRTSQGILLTKYFVRFIHLSLFRGGPIARNQACSP